MITVGEIMGVVEVVDRVEVSKKKLIIIKTGNHTITDASTCFSVLDKIV